MRQILPLWWISYTTANMRRMIMKYFAYGSNLHKGDLVKWCNNNGQKIPNMLNPQVVRLENYTIGFTRKSISRGGGVADIIRSPGDFCYGVVFDVTEADLKILDIKEGVESGDYKRLEVSEGLVTYEVAKKTNFVKPSTEYMDLIIQGAKYYGLPQIWIDRLESFKK